MNKTKTTSFNAEKLGIRLGRMPDHELLRFGQVLKYMCSPDANLGQPPRQEFVVQLHAARAEWRRRFPKLPLSPSV